ncbi:MAG: hypothetical protein R2856_33245 [Caldilineaceae bacterium]
MKRRYCTGSGSFSPICSRNSSMRSGVTAALGPGQHQLRRISRAARA